MDPHDFSGMEDDDLKVALIHWYLELIKAQEIYSALLEEDRRRRPRREIGWSD